ncbi:hypothetical protein NoPa_00134 [Pseudomonas phage vB_PpuM-NoPa]|uniref:Uncharacterized protein n=1 Tax=Pseudomonas phage vB_PpuM-NoPa TaxID=3132619 RepID=A0AAX4MZG0_9CAUD
METFAMWVAIYWLVTGVVGFFYSLLWARVEQGYVNKDMFNESLLAFVFGGLLTPVMIIGDLLRLARWVILGIFNIGARNK